MSIRSKAKRDARKKKSKTPSRPAPARQIVEHAHLIDGRGNILGGAGLRGQEWVMVLGGKVIAGTGSAAMVLAMLKHVAGLRELSGNAVQLNYSTQLRDAATADAVAEGKSLDEYLELLAAECEERAERAIESRQESNTGQLS